MACDRVMVRKFTTQVLELRGLVNSIAGFSEASVIRMEGLDLKDLFPFENIVHVVTCANTHGDYAGGTRLHSFNPREASFPSQSKIYQH